MLIACADGLRYFDAKGATAKQADSKLVCSDPIFLAAKDIVVAQDGNDLSIWGSNEKGQLGYITTTVDDIDNGSLQAVQLLEDNRATMFSTCIAKPNPDQGRNTVWQAIIANNDDGKLTLLQQHRDTGIWRPEPFVISYEKKNVKVESYTISIQIKAADGQNLSNGQLLVRSSSAATAIVNGKTAFLSSSGSWLKADQAGEVNLIIPTASISGQAFTFAGARNSDGSDLEFKQQIFDPSRKVLEAIGALTSFDKLSNATTKDQKTSVERE